MRSTIRRVVPVGLLLVPAIAGAYGGWATITVEDLPDYAVTGRPVNLTFTVRQHGVHPLAGLRPRVGSPSTPRQDSAPARPGSVDGEYIATIAPTDTGEWTITIHSGFGTSSTTLLPIRVISRGNQPPPPLDNTERGRRLFVAKGCVTCHLHRDFNAPTIPVGPELTAREFPSAYLSQVLTNPAAVARSLPAKATMPNLHLKPAEIAALVAFLNGQSRAANN